MESVTHRFCKLIDDDPTLLANWIELASQEDWSADRAMRYACSCHNVLMARNPGVSSSFVKSALEMFFEDIDWELVAFHYKLRSSLPSSGAAKERKG